MTEEKVLQITKEELHSLEEQLEYLKLVKKPEVIKRLQIARSYGDLSENSEYDAAKDERNFVEEEITRIEQQIRTARIVDLDSIEEDVVSIGKTIKVYMGDTQQEEVYKIVGNTNINVLDSRVSLEAPFGQAVNGKRIGDTVTILAPNGPYEATILSVEKTISQ